MYKYKTLGYTGLFSLHVERPSYIYRTTGFMEFDRLFLLMSKDFRAPFASYRKGALSRIQRHVLMILSGSLVQ